MITKRFYDKSNGWNDRCTEFSNKFEELYKPLFNEYINKGYSVAEISYLTNLTLSNIGSMMAIFDK